MFSTQHDLPKKTAMTCHDLGYTPHFDHPTDLSLNIFYHGHPWPFATAQIVPSAPALRTSRSRGRRAEGAEGPVSFLSFGVRDPAQKSVEKTTVSVRYNI